MSALPASKTWSRVHAAHSVAAAALPARVYRPDTQRHPINITHAEFQKVQKGICATRTFLGRQFWHSTE